MKRNSKRNNADRMETLRRKEIRRTKYVVRKLEVAR